MAPAKSEKKSLKRPVMPLKGKKKAVHKKKKVDRTKPKRKQSTSTRNKEKRVRTEKYQSFICAQLAAGCSPQVVAEMVEEQFGVKVTRQNIHKNYLCGMKWRAKINRMRRYFEKAALKHPLSNKLNRLNLIQQGINECLTWRLDKLVYDRGKREMVKIMKRNIGSLSSLIDRARVESEGEKALIEINDNQTHVYVPQTDDFQSTQDPDGVG